MVRHLVSNSTNQRIATRRLQLAALAVIGTLVYGASLGQSFPQRPAVGLGIWLGCSAGLAWILFGSTLVLVARLGLVDCIDLCLAAMGWGELPLLAGAAGNLLLAHVHAASSGLWRDAWSFDWNIAWNVACVAFSNLVMAEKIERLADAVPMWKSRLLFFVVLNGSGALLAWVFWRLFCELRILGGG